MRARDRAALVAGVSAPFSGTNGTSTLWKGMRIALASLVCLLAVSCRSPQPAAPVTHVVICWLKSPGDETGRQRIIDATETPRKIPGVLAVTAGTAVPSTRPIVDSSFDVGIVITFQ